MPRGKPNPPPTEPAYNTTTDPRQWYSEAFSTDSAEREFHIWDPGYNPPRRIGVIIGKVNIDALWAILRGGSSGISY